MIRAVGHPAEDSLEKSRILVVDDEEIILACHRDMLGLTRTVFTAHDPREALGILERERVDVIVSDYKMPGGDGISLLIEVKKRYPNVIRVLMTAYADMQLVIRALNEGEIHRFISKPCNFIEFRRILEECEGLARMVGHRVSAPRERTVLVAHDSTTSQASLRLMLTPAYQMIATSNGIEALNLLSTRKVDAVVLGVALDQLDGCSIASYLKQEQRSATPLAFWTRGVEGPYEEYLHGCGADIVLDEDDRDAPARLLKFLKKKLS